MISLIDELIETIGKIRQNRETNASAVKEQNILVESEIRELRRKIDKHLDKFVMLLCVFCSLSGSSSVSLEVVFMVDSNTLSSSSLLSSLVWSATGANQRILLGIYFCPVILRLMRGRQNAHAGYVNEPSLLTTEPSSAMIVMTRSPH
jgi:hypothetical protein